MRGEIKVILKKRKANLVRRGSVCNEHFISNFKAPTLDILIEEDAENQSDHEKNNDVQSPKVEVEQTK